MVEKGGSAASPRGGRRTDAASPTTFMVEVGGSGGVFQHSLAMCVALTELGIPTRLLTAREREIDDPRVATIPVFRWYRKAPRGIRQLLIVAYFLVRTVPRVASSRGTVWVQGTFKPVLTLILLWACRVARQRVIFSPHTLFSRHGGRLQQLALDACIRTAPEIVVYNAPDADRLRAGGQVVHELDMLMYTPVVPPDVSEKWRQYVHKWGIKVCSVGQIRADKNLPMLAEAASRAQAPLLVMGQDTGALEELNRTINSLPNGSCQVVEGYSPLADMAAAVSATGVVALPYSVAATSAVAVIAKAYGATVVAFEVGGLTGQADVLVDSLEPAAWAEALKRAVDLPRASRTTPAPMDVKGASNLRAMLSGEGRK